jgi:hypothetical protein
MRPIDSNKSIMEGARNWSNHCDFLEVRFSDAADHGRETQQDAGADVSALARDLDEVVDALYALTWKEIKIVEHFAK